MRWTTIIVLVYHTASTPCFFGIKHLVIIKRVSVSAVFDALHLLIWLTVCLG